MRAGRRPSPLPPLPLSRAIAIIVGAAALVVASVFLLPAERLSLAYDWFQNWRYHKDFLRSAIFEDATVPLWCRWSFSGKPFLADAETMLFYPGTLLYVLLPSGTALRVDVLVHFALAGIGMLLFCRARGAQAWAGVFASIAWLACGFNIAHTAVGHIHYYAAVAWLPFVFLCVEKWTAGGSPLWIATGAACLAVQFFAGALAVSWMTMAFGALYGAGRLLETLGWPLGKGPRRMKAAAVRLVGLASIFAVGLLLASAQALPTRELASLSLREGRGYEFAASDSLPPAEALHLLSPPLLGKRIPWEFYGYFGLAPLALAGAAAAGGLLRRGGGVLLALAGLAFVLMLGDATPLFRVLYVVMPGLSLFRTHAREVCLLSFCLITLAAAGLDAILARPAGEGGKMGTFVRGAAAVIGGGAVLIAISLPSRPAEGSAGWQLLWLAVALATAGALWMVGPERRWSPAALAAVLLLDLLAAERVVRDRITIPTGPPPGQEELARVLRKDPGDYRFWFARSHFMSDQGYSERRSAVEGYENMLLKRYQSYIHAMTGAPVKPDVINILTQSNFRYAPKPFPFKALNVKYAAIPGEGDAYRLHVNPAPCGSAFIADRYEVLAEKDILEAMRSDEFDPRRTALLEEPPPGGPRALPDDSGPAGEASVTRSTPNRILLSAQVRRPAILVLSEIHYPGWRVRVDGAEQKLLRADYILRAVALPPGRHQVEFFFLPTSLARGLALSAAGLAACAVLLAAGLRTGAPAVLTGLPEAVADAPNTSSRRRERPPPRGRALPRG